MIWIYQLRASPRRTSIGYEIILLPKISKRHCRGNQNKGSANIEWQCLPEIKDPTVSSSAWIIESPYAYGTYRGSGIAQGHKIRTSDAYRRELFGIFLGITALREIFSRQDVKKVSATMGYDGASALRSAQYHNSSHPIHKSNAALRKGIMTMRD